MITLDYLEELAKRVVNEPWGVGDPILQKNSESWAPYLRFLHAVVKYIRPRAVVECGVYMGTATMHMAVANRKTMVIGIDRDFHQAAQAVKSFNNIWLVHGDTVSSEEVVASMLGDRKIGLLFLDSTHDGDTPTREYNTYSKYFADECIVACDDIYGPDHLAEKMQEFWRWLPGDKRELNFLHPTPDPSWGYEIGFGVSIVRGDDA